MLSNTDYNISDDGSWGVEWKEEYTYDDDGNVVKTGKTGEWINSYLLENGVIKNGSTGEWVNQFWLDGDVLKEGMTGEWINYVLLKNSVDISLLAIIMDDWNMEKK
jgi:hypothetical protein